MEARLKDIIYIYENQISKNVKNKTKLLNFEKNKMQNLVNIYNELLNNTHKIEHYSIFLIREPKKRIVMSLNIHDKIINHYMTEFVLKPKLEKYLDCRNIATRKGLGSDYGIKLIKKYLEKLKKYENIYVLKIDISKYFYNIDHSVLKSMIKEDLTSDEYNIISSIIDSTNISYIHNIIGRFQTKDNSLPNYTFDKGLPIGNLTSQFLSVFYLNRLDHYIVHDLHLKYYVRYMDDFIILHHNKKYLIKCLEKITEKLKNEYYLNVNINKTKITNVKEGFIFLGYNFRIRNKKTVIFIRKETKRKCKKRIKAINYLYDNDYIKFAKYFMSLNNYYHTFKYANNYKILKYININY